MPPVSARIFGVNVRLAPGLRPKGTRASPVLERPLYPRAERQIVSQQDRFWGEGV